MLKIDFFMFFINQLEMTDKSHKKVVSLIIGTVFIATCFTTCIQNHSYQQDNRLDSVLCNDQIAIDCTVGIDSMQRTIFISSDYRNSKSRKTASPAGLVYLDGAYVSPSETFLPGKTPATFAGRHKLVIIFPDDMENFDLYLMETKSKRKDSLIITFDAPLTGVRRVLKGSADSVRFEMTSGIQNQNVFVQVFPIPLKGGGVAVPEAAFRLRSRVENGRFSFHKDSIRKQDFTHYYFLFGFSKQTPILFNDKKKGDFYLNFNAPQLKVSL